MHVQDQPVYVLHRRPWRDSSLLLDVLSLDHGRQCLIARGALGGKRNAAAWMQPGQPLIVSWSGRSGLKTLTGYDTPEQLDPLQGERLFCGFYLSELLLTLLPEQEAAPVLYSIYAETVSALPRITPVSALLRRFELVLLQQTGLAPDFERDVSGRSIVVGAVYRLLVEQGFCPVTATDPEHGTRFRGEVIAALAALPDQPAGTVALGASVSSDAKRLMRQLIDRAFNGRPLKSRDLFKQKGAS
jgi:DNA repair protein RecO (recombination protein O)